MLRIVNVRGSVVSLNFVFTNPAEDKQEKLELNSFS